MVLIRYFLFYTHVFFRILSIFEFLDKTFFFQFVPSKILGINTFPKMKTFYKSSTLFRLELQLCFCSRSKKLFLAFLFFSSLPFFLKESKRGKLLKETISPSSLILNKISIFSPTRNTFFASRISLYKSTFFSWSAHITFKKHFFARTCRKRVQDFSFRTIFYAFFVFFLLFYYTYLQNWCFENFWSQSKRKNRHFELSSYFCNSLLTFEIFHIFSFIIERAFLFIFFKRVFSRLFERSLFLMYVFPFPKFLNHFVFPT